MTNEKISALWWWLIDMGIATMEELKLITEIIGYNTDTLNKVLYCRTGYRDREQMESEQVDQEYIDYLKEQESEQKSKKRRKVAK